MATPNGWLPSHSVAALLLATARAGTRPASNLIEELLTEHIRVPGLSADALMHSASEEIEASWKDSGLRGVLSSLQAHCARLSDSLDEGDRRRIVGQMLQVASAVSGDRTREANIRAFPYAAARVWKLDDVAQTIIR
ncbi:MAG: hypothetical protein AAFV53_14505 [Myxococcota bacterium]